MVTLPSAAALVLPVLLAAPASAALDVLKLLSPSALDFPTENYDGFQLRWKNLVFRPALFKFEGFLLLAILAYFLVSRLGHESNSRRVSKWLEAHRSVYETQFSKPFGATPIVADGSSDFSVFSTGRRGLYALHTVFTLLPRQDIFQLIFEYAWTLVQLDYKPQDEILLDFKLRPSAAPSFVWGVVAKDEMRPLRGTRWDLTFTRTSENAAVDSTLSVMSEYADLTDTIIGSPQTAAFFKLLKDPAVLAVFRSLIITDQPEERPESGPIPADRKERRVLLRLTSPTSSQLDASVQFVKSVFGFVDLLDGKLGLRPETVKKLEKTRKDLDDELTKEALAEKKQELEEEKRAAKRKAEEERVSKLSAAEQQKYQQNQAKKAMRKAQGKIARK
ncbi:hypothetical protein BOTBODRAFT_26780 [Botryobasidium botryosum FD-172 SS1]|uniref:DUF1682-domain-containing protein n=1 Tax=Botryobasidium botryosum (strain FD-172 SS1) TaxID=930990 RepID=A0A067MYE1_BOTB1|nr:hypothetical protein BOTBODRAFT_26780 [Botryobasidium botryosum FD-172 SS1]